MKCVGIVVKILNSCGEMGEYCYIGRYGDEIEGPRSYSEKIVTTTKRNHGVVLDRSKC